MEVAESLLGMSQQDPPLEEECSVSMTNVENLDEVEFDPEDIASLSTTTSPKTNRDFVVLRGKGGLVPTWCGKGKKHLRPVRVTYKAMRTSFRRKISEQSENFSKDLTELTMLASSLQKVLPSKTLDIVQRKTQGLMSLVADLLSLGDDLGGRVTGQMWTMLWKQLNSQVPIKFLVLCTIINR
jgi:hypothetical protein